MATLSEIRNTENSKPRENMQQDVLCNEAFLRPACFEMIFNTLNIRDVKFCRIVKVLANSCKQMNQNSPKILENFFLSDKFFKMFVNINKMIDEICMLTKKYPEMTMKWDGRHKQMIHFRSELLKFLENQFEKVWVQHFTSTAESVRVKVWPFDENCHV